MLLRAADRGAWLAGRVWGQSRFFLRRSKPLRKVHEVSPAGFMSVFGAGVIPPNAELKFDVELFGFK